MDTPHKNIFFLDSFLTITIIYFFAFQPLHRTQCQDRHEIVLCISLMLHAGFICVRGCHKALRRGRKQSLVFSFVPMKLCVSCVQRSHTKLGNNHGVCVGGGVLRVHCSLFL
ncbi:hypothetical protein XENTR_v10008176 [Xenopus tropicalis]|nr:hypothetical protein XENTR_v10008176 [Xenopus tropicalis]